MNWPNSVRSGATLLALLAASCSDSASNPAGPGVSSIRQRSTEGEPANPDSGDIPKAEEAKPPASKPSTFSEDPSQSGYAELPEPTSKQDRCPGDKRRRKDWAALWAAKEAHAAARAAANAAAEQSAAPDSPPSQDLLNRQQRFLDAVEAQRAEMDAMSQEDRERVYQDLKQQMLGY